MISIIIPTYNEEKYIGETISDLKNSIREELEIIVVDDGSDNTAEIARQHEVEVIKYSTRKGKGYAVRQGFCAAKGEIICFADADGSLSGEGMNKLIKSLKNDGVIASRHLKASDVDFGRGPFYYLMGRLFNKFTKLFFNLKYQDTQCGYKVFKSKCIDAVLPEMKVDGFGFDVELLWLCQKRGFKVREIPVRWVHKADDSRFTLDFISEVFCQLLKRRFKRS